MSCCYSLLFFSFTLSRLGGKVALLPLNEFYPFGSSNGDSSVPQNDDGSSGRVTISNLFPFFDDNYGSLFVNTNGALSFKIEVSQYTPHPFPLGDGRRLVAPFWGDVDTTRGGIVWYRETVDPALLQRATSEIRAAWVDHPRYKATWLMVATWDNVAFYGAENHFKTRTNTFQVVLVTNGRHSFAIFNYHKLVWTTGTASNGGPDGLGGTPAQAGFNAGDGIRFYNIPGSMTGDVLNLTKTSNVNIPGRWMFRIDDASVESGGCNVEGSLTVWPSTGNMLGGENIFLAGPCYNKATDKLICKFNDQLSTNGTVINEIRARCTVPIMNVTGRISLALSVNGGHSFDFKGKFNLVPINRSPPRITRGNPKDSWIENNPSKVTWNPNDLGNQTGRVSIQIARFENDLGHIKFHSFQSVIDDQENNGQSTIVIGGGEELMLGDENSDIKSEEKKKDDRYVNLVRIVSNSNESEIDQSSAKWIWSDVFVWTDYKNARERCNRWFEKEPDPSVFTEDPSNPPCPLTVQQAMADRGRYMEEKRCDEQDTECLWSRESASFCFNSATPSSRGAGEQCCYNRQGNLMVGPGDPDAGSLNRVHMDSDVPVISHFSNDQVPYQDCCKWSDNCEKYFEKRPSDDGSRYQVPRPTTGFGDPHMITLDGVEYTFNGYGEYTLLRINTTGFILQGRMQPLIRSNGVEDRATVYKAFAMKENGSDVVEISLSRRKEVHVLINGEKQNFEEQLILNFNRVIVMKYENATKYSVMLHSGVSVTVEGFRDLLQVMIMVPVDHKGNTSGLMGYWDDNREREFLLPNGDFLKTDSSLRDLHYQFGQKWATAAIESLFTYERGKDHSSYSRPQYTPIFFKEEDVISFSRLNQDAQAACNNKLQCLFDIQTTGKIAIGQSSRQAAEVFEAVINDTEITDICAARQHNCSQICSISNTSPWGFNCSCRLGFELKLDQVTCNDTDECLSKHGGCSDTCINIKGSYRCTCHTGFVLTRDLHTCKDLDECAEGASGCSQGCTNTIGGYKCHCHQGFRMSNDNHTCEDIDECSEKVSGCSQWCHNTVGGYICYCRQGFQLAPDNHTCQGVCDMGLHNCTQICTTSDHSWGFNCSCRDGFKLNDDGITCIDVDECTQGMSGCSQGCRNIVGGYECYCTSGFILNADSHTCQHICKTGAHNCSHSCVPTNNTRGFNCSCANGYELKEDGVTCLDINECRANTSGCSQGCNNTEGGYHCFCKDGYRLSAADARTCQDVDECKEKTSGCSQKCNNTVGSYQCSCGDGYRMTEDNHTCADIDECREKASGCSQECNNTIGSYKCYCRDGFRLTVDKHTCEDIDECKEKTSGCSQECNNTIGSYKCYCRDGFRLTNDSHTCEDVDECREKTSGCSQECNNTIGSYKCYCRDGFRLINDSHTCKDIDECKEKTSGCSQECNNTIGSYKCYCRDGFRLTNDSHTCEDVDECKEEISGCSQECNNTIGSYKCFCRDGFRLTNDSHTCEDIDECKHKTSGCSQECNNTIGSYKCYCRDGFRLTNDSHSCEDIDECREKTSGCSQECNNTIGSYKCYCRDGFHLTNNSHTCEDINECREKTSGCSQECYNTIGSYKCYCRDGFRLTNDGHTCEDVDECREKTSSCSQDCNNTIGSYKCYCRDGFRLINDSHTCEDIDECREKGSGCSQECNNTIGSYKCYCRDGFRLTNDSHTCEDVDECKEKTSGCSQECNNTIGSYKCFCKDGFRLTNNSHTCEDIDECKQKTSGCSQECNNTIGSYKCYCRDGFLLTNDSHTCEDIDECKQNTSGCSQECNNTIGSYKCYCRNGFRLINDSHTCEDINECREKTNGCSQDCNNTIGSYKCFCKDGFRLTNDKHTCEDINECREKTSGCSQECNNTIGSYKCYCRDGFRLTVDKHTCEDIDECRELLSHCSQDCSNLEGSYQCHCRDGFFLSQDNHSCEVNDSTVAVENHAVEIVVNRFNLSEWENRKTLFQVTVASAVQIFCEGSDSVCNKPVRERRDGSKQLITPNDVKFLSGYPIQIGQDLVIAFFVVVTSWQTILPQEALLDFTKSHEALTKIASSLGKNVSDITVTAHTTKHIAQPPQTEGHYKMIILGACLGLVALALFILSLFIFRRRRTKRWEPEVDRKISTKEPMLKNENTSVEKRGPEMCMQRLVKV